MLRSTTQAVQTIYEYDVSIKCVLEKHCRKVLLLLLRHRIINKHFTALSRYTGVTSLPVLESTGLPTRACLFCLTRALMNLREPPTNPRLRLTSDNHPHGVLKP